MPRSDPVSLVLPNPFSERPSSTSPSVLMSQEASQPLLSSGVTAQINTQYRSRGRGINPSVFSSSLSTSDLNTSPIVSPTARTLSKRRSESNYSAEGVPRNVQYANWPRHHYEDIYYWGLRLSWGHFVLVLAAIFVLQVVAFALLSLACRGDIAPYPSLPELLLLHFLVYSGYGTGIYACTGVAVSVLLSVETLFRTVYFTIVTGLLYARFAKPIPRIRFTSHVCISLQSSGSLHSSHPLLCLRMANDRLESLLNTQVQLTMSLTKRSEDGRSSFRQFHDLVLRRNSLPTFLLPWTVMHEISDKSPLHGLSPAEMLAAGVEIFVVVNAVDSVFGGGIWARKSYGMDDILWGRRFADVFSSLQQGDETVRVVDMAKMELTLVEEDEKQAGKGMVEEAKAAREGREEQGEGEEEEADEEEDEGEAAGQGANASAVSVNSSVQRLAKQQV